MGNVVSQNQLRRPSEALAPPCQRAVSPEHVPALCHPAVPSQRVLQLPAGAQQCLMIHSERDRAELPVLAAVTAALTPNSGLVPVSLPSRGCPVSPEGAALPVRGVGHTRDRCRSRCPVLPPVPCGRTRRCCPQRGLRTPAHRGLGVLSRHRGARTGPSPCAPRTPGSPRESRTPRTPRTPRIPRTA